MIAENKKLVNFQERVEKVNNEINYQKINLTKANDDLAKINEETRSLIDVKESIRKFSFDGKFNNGIGKTIDTGKLAPDGHYYYHGPHDFTDDEQNKNQDPDNNI